MNVDLLVYLSYMRLGIKGTLERLGSHLGPGKGSPHLWTDRGKTKAYTKVDRMANI